MEISFSQVIPILRIFDIAKADEFYLGFLGFSVDFDHRFEPDFRSIAGSRAAACCCISASIMATAVRAPKSGS